MTDEEILAVLEQRKQHVLEEFSDGQSISFVNYTVPSSNLKKELKRREFKNLPDDALFGKIKALDTYWRVAAEELEARRAGQ